VGNCVRHLNIAVITYFSYTFIDTMHSFLVKYTFFHTIYFI